MPTIAAMQAGLTPHQLLANDIIRLAIFDASSRNSELRTDALDFLFGERSQQDLELWCMILGVNPNKVQKLAQKKINRRLAKRQARMVE